MTGRISQIFSGDHSPQVRAGGAVAGFEAGNSGDSMRLHIPAFEWTNAICGALGAAGEIGFFMFTPKSRAKEEQ